MLLSTTTITPIVLKYIYIYIDTPYITLINVFNCLKYISMYISYKKC